MVSEVQQRINFLMSGPWIERGKDAWDRIGKPPRSSKERIPGSQTQRDLKNLLRPHWRKAIVRKEGLVRDAFDEALTIYQLYELAIENQYISVGDIKEQVQQELTNLLWSEGARDYLYNYSYIGVIYLAQRVGVDLGFLPVKLPQIRDGSEGRFAAFLSQHMLWYSDPILDGWLGFLDDYQEYRDDDMSDKKVFWTFLRTKQRKFEDEPALWTFVAGADRLVTRLADLARMLCEEEWSSYGLFYGYWLSKLYGYDLTDDGYTLDDDQVDWSKAILESKRIAYVIDQSKRGKKGGADPQGLLDAFELRDGVVRQLWAQTIAHLNSDPMVLKP
jgi:hypothetical protein